MSCPECDAVREQYLIFVKAVREFGMTLEQLDAERQRILDRNRPKGAQPIDCRRSA